MKRNNKVRYNASLVNDGPKIEHREGTISVRPLKIAFLFNRSYGINKFRDIIQFNSMVWSGVYNIILPHDGDSLEECWLYSLREYDPDILIRVGDLGDDYFRALRDVVQPFRHFDWSDRLLDFQEWRNSLQNPGTVPIIYYYNYIFKNDRPMSPENSNIRVPAVEEDDPNAPYIEAMFGCLPKDHRDVLIKDLHATEVPFPKGVFTGYLDAISKFRRKVHPLYMTQKDISHRIYHDMSGAIVVLTQNNALDDLCIYWNQRGGPGFLGKKDVFIVPCQPLTDESALQHLADWCVATITHSNTLHLWSSSVPKEDLIALKERLKPKLKGGLQRIDLRYGNFRNPSYRCYVREHTQRLRIENRCLTLSAPKIPWMEENEYCQYAVDVAFRDTRDKSKRFLPPRYVGLNSFLCDNSGLKSWFRPRNESFFRITGEWFSCAAKANKDSYGVFLPGDEEIFERLIRFYKLEPQMTDKCRYIRRIIDLFGGLDEIQLIREKKWQELFTALHKEALDIDTIKILLLKAIPRIADKEERNKTSAKTDDRLAELALKKILLRGHTMRCPSCGYTHWYPVESMSETIHCEGCRATIQPPMNGPFTYQLNALVARGIEQGVFPVLLTILYLREICVTAFHYLPGVEVTNGDSKCDVDLIAACDGNLVVAECKTLESTAPGKIDRLKIHLQQASEMLNVAGHQETDSIQKGKESLRNASVIAEELDNRVIFNVAKIKKQFATTVGIAEQINARVCFLATQMDESEQSTATLFEDLEHFTSDLNARQQDNRLAIHLLGPSHFKYDRIPVEIRGKEGWPTLEENNILKFLPSDPLSTFNWKEGAILDEGASESWIKNI